MHPIDSGSTSGTVSFPIGASGTDRHAIVYVCASRIIFLLHHLWDHLCLWVQPEPHRLFLWILPVSDPCSREKGTKKG